MNLSRMVDISNVSIRQSAATSLSDAVDMPGFEGCMFIVCGSTLLEGSTNVSVYLKGSTASGGTYTSLRGTSSEFKCTSTAAPVTGAKNYRLFVADYYKSGSTSYRYVKACVAGASSDVAYLNNIVAVRYGTRKQGSTVLNQSTTVSNTTILLSPTSG